MSKFEHVNLADVDPGQASLPDRVYTLQVADAALKTFMYKPGSKKYVEGGSEEENTGEYIQVQLAIAEDPEFSGRRVFQTLWPGKGTNKQLRQLMEITGIAPEGPLAEGQDYVNYLKEFKNQRVQFRMPVTTTDKPDADGTPRKRTEANFWEISPS